jgi:hypothetical protein
MTRGGQQKQEIAQQGEVHQGFMKWWTVLNMVIKFELHKMQRI